MGELQRRLQTAIINVFKDRSQWSVNKRAEPRVDVYRNGMEISGASQALLQFRRSAREIGVDLEFRGPGLAATFRGYFLDVPLEPGVPANPPSPVGDVPRPGKVVLVHAKSQFRVGDLLEVRIELRRSSSLYCFLQHKNGEATLLYPAFREQENRFGKGEMKFPDDFGLKAYNIRYTDQVDEYLYCIATREPLPELKKWFENTYMQRNVQKELARFMHQDEQSLAVASREAREILLQLRQSEGYADEDKAEIKVAR